ncbi:MAG: thioredoxin family protein [Phycisphaerales bacterium]|nr:MAG: thioredoxin family protein [Phycisphaerales bacterium]
MRTQHTLTGLVLAITIALAGCSGAPTPAEPAAAQEPGMTSEPTEPAGPPPAIRAWMERLTVPHAYDPETGFIAARETIELPPLLADAPPLDEALAEAERDGRLVIAFATADRCAPCQQYKKDALNDPRVLARLADPRLLATHVEVDRRPELAQEHLGSLAIPMSYALRDGQRVATLRGQRTPEELLAWLEALLAG